MRKLTLCAAAVSIFLLAFASLAIAEEEQIAQIFFYTVKPGMEKQFEAGAKKHMDWHRKQNDPWGWVTWEIIAGENVGMMGTGTFGHTWSEFDSPQVSREADEADAKMSVFPYIDLKAVQFYRHLTEMSRPSEGMSAMTHVVGFHVHPGKTGDFEYVVKKFHEAILKTNWPSHYNWFRLAAGGEGPLYVLVLPRKNWAAFKPMEKPFGAMVEEAYGRQEAQALFEMWNASVRSQFSEINKARPDISYVPAGK